MNIETGQKMRIRPHLGNSMVIDGNIPFPLDSVMNEFVEHINHHVSPLGDKFLPRTHRQFQNATSQETVFAN